MFVNKTCELLFKTLNLKFTVKIKWFCLIVYLITCIYLFFKVCIMDMHCVVFLFFIKLVE